MSVLDSTMSMFDIRPRKNAQFLYIACNCARPASPSRSMKRLYRAAETEPAGQQGAVQAPAEYPGDGAQIFDAIRWLA